MQNDSVFKTVTVALILCIVCSIMVSGSAISLKPMQERNKRFDIKKNLLLASGLIKDSNVSKQEVDEAFKSIETKVIDVSTGEEVSDINPDTYDQREAAKDPKQNVKIPGDRDLAHIKVRAKYAKVYLVKEGGQVKMIVLPIHGKGLWSTLYGFIALNSDTRTIKGIGFYQHGETPGLGGEVDNPRWKAQWEGKMAYTSDFEPVIQVIKGTVNPKSSQAKYQIDGLSGATLTSNGVTNLVRYWLGSSGYGTYLEKFRHTYGG